MSNLPVMNGDKLYVMQLFISGATQHSTLAVRNLKQICEKYIPDQYSLEIIDVYQQPRLAEDMKIIATPTLIKTSPLPTRRLVGDMSDTAAVLSGLGISGV